MKVAVTGHRPNKLGGYNPLAPLNLAIKELLREKVELIKPRSMISGMALGVDTMWAEIAMEKRIPLIAAIPFEFQYIRWPSESQHHYRKLLNYATRVINVSDDVKYRPQYMQWRNEWMVNNCNVLVAVWDGSPGGTCNCVNYATKKLHSSQIIYLDPTKIKL